MENPVDSSQKNQIDGGMQDSIKSILAKSQLSLSIYENTIRSNKIKEQLTLKDNLMLRFQSAKELLNMGNTQEAISLINSILNTQGTSKRITNETKMLHEFLAICFLRLGEQENCQINHNDDSCIIPIQEKGLHQLTNGSEKAIEKYEQILAIFPEDYQSRWLLNLAYMTLGKYPDQVPNKFFIEIGDKNQDSSFQNIASQMGIDMFDLSGSVITDDFNNDGYIDIITSSWGINGKVKFYANKGASGFKDETAEAGLNDIKGGLNLKQADIDNDGDLDFIILRGAWRPLRSWGILPNSLLINNGNAQFEDQTITKGLYSIKPTQSAEWFDFNNDGWIDLFVANETTSSSTEKFPCELFLNNGQGGFSEIAKSVNADVTGYFKGVTSGDINNDGLRDIFISNLQGPNVLLLNKGNAFKNVTSQSGVEKPFAAFPCWFFDANNDGWDDLYVSSFPNEAFTDQSGQFARDFLNKKVSAEPSKLFINDKQNKFLDKSSDYMNYTSLATMGSNYGDIDNDGYLDFYLGTGAPDYRSVVPNRFFKNDSGGSFSDETFALGLGHIQKGHGISFADLNNDGNQDIYAVMGGAFEGDVFPNALFENPGSDHNWIKLLLKGTDSNHSAIGARLELTCVVAGIERVIYHTVSSGASFGANALIAHLGLGNASSIKSLTVQWPNKALTKTEYTGLELNTTYSIVENESTPKPVETKSFTFKKSDPAGHTHHH